MDQPAKILFGRIGARVCSAFRQKFSLAALALVSALRFGKNSLWPPRLAAIIRAPRPR
jgi:hypothetical protein